MANKYSKYLPPSKGWGSSSGSYKRCLESHPALPLTEGLVIYGGSCSSPVVTDADVYIGFDYSMKFTGRHFPWNEGCEVYYHINDMQAPANAETFFQLVDWAADQLTIGHKVHAGCIGGHGRTGTFFAALVCQMLGEKDAITYVRDNYCKKAVETKAQIDFLHKHYGIKKVDGSKTGWGGASPKNPGVKKVETISGVSTCKPKPLPGNIWGQPVHADYK